MGVKEQPAPLVYPNVSGQPPRKPLAQPLPSLYHPQGFLSVNKARNHCHPTAGLKDFPADLSRASSLDLAEEIVGRSPFLTENPPTNHQRLLSTT